MSGTEPDSDDGWGAAPAAPVGGWDDPHDDWTARPTVPVSVQVPAASAVAVPLGDSARVVTEPGAPIERARSARGLAITALALAIIASIALGGGLFMTLTTLELISPDPARHVGFWLTFVSIGLVLALVALVLAIIAAVLGRWRLLPVVTLLVALLAPPVLTVVGIQQGASDLYAHTMQDAAGSSELAASTLADWAAKFGIDASTVTDWIEQFSDS